MGYVASCVVLVSSLVEVDRLVLQALPTICGGALARGGSSPLTLAKEKGERERVRVRERERTKNARQASN